VDIQTATKGYFQKRTELEKNWGNPGQLSDVMLKMSTYLSYIADSLGLLKEEYESERAKEYLAMMNQGASASSAENQARAKTAEIRGQAAKLELMVKSGNNLVSVGQSRLRVLENESRNQT
jgi:hypothetical protein